MGFVEATLRWQRRALGVAVAGSALLFWRGTLDVFNTTKATVVAVAALAIAVLSAVRVMRTRRVVVPRGGVWWVLGAFVTGLVVATAVSAVPWISVVGRPGRHTGLAMYLVYLVLFVATIRLYRDERPDGLLRVLLLAAVPIVGYGLLQVAGVEPFGWEIVEGGPAVFSTFGNANFFSAWVGVIVPLAVYGALAVHWQPLMRAVAVLVATGGFAAALGSRSLQGPGIALLGTAVVGAVWLFTTESPVRRIRVPLFVGAALAAAGGFVALLVDAGWLQSVRPLAARSLETRVNKWGTALQMVPDRPVAGFGLDAFADWYHVYRTPELAAVEGLRRTTDTPHMVPLDMLVSGGVLLALPYLAVVVCVAWSLSRALRRTTGQQRLLVGGLAGAWVAYQAQSLVSIDVPPLAVMHWVLAGLIVAAAKPELAIWTLPGAPALRAPPPGRRRRKDRRQEIPLVGAPLPGLIGLAVVTVLALWLTSAPIRADLRAGAAQRAFASGQANEAERLWERASAVGFWEAQYPALHAEVARARNDLERALALYEEAARRDPRGLAHQVNFARTAGAMGLDERADEAYGRTLDLDPHTPEILVEVARHHLARDRAEAARALLERAVDLRADEPEWWVALGQARAATGDTDGARTAFETALRLDPEADGAAEGLEGLPA